MAHRKLQQEIDKVFKKINEGLEIFNSIHERHESSTNSSQRDKLENDLKREVKKLQKQREQIKVWQSTSEVKDKDQLLEYRRLVEVAMEKYKVVEKGSKIKAYSNVNLKNYQELDPEQKEKQDVEDFLQESIDELELQYQQVEVELEKLTKKKKSNSVAIKELKEFQEKYRWHQQQLELILRLLSNDELAIDEILEIKEEIEYFISNNRNNDFIENEYLYESLDLESNEMLQQEIAQSFNQLKEKSPTPEKKEKRERKSKAEKEDRSKDAKNAHTTTSTTTNASTSTVPVTPSVSLPPVVPKEDVINISDSLTSLRPAPVPKEVKWSALLSNAKESEKAEVKEKINEEVKKEQKIHVQKEQQEEELQQQQQQQLQQQPQEELSKDESRPEREDTISPREEKEDVNLEPYLNDASLVSAPPGIQDIILSYYSSKLERKTISNVSNLLTINKPYLEQNIPYNYSKSMELTKCCNIWNFVRLNLELISSIDEMTLFYAFYYSLSPMEANLVSKELNKRGWIENGLNWLNKELKFDVVLWEIV